MLHDWIPHLRALNVNALYLGPLFESSAHGYDTADFFHVDRRLGTNETLAQLSGALHKNGIRLVLDGVFHHVGRDFWAFHDLLQNGEGSAYRHWFSGLDFSRPPDQRGQGVLFALPSCQAVAQLSQPAGGGLGLPLQSLHQPALFRQRGGDFTDALEHGLL